MRKLLGAALLALSPALALAAEAPEWAYPVTPKLQPSTDPTPLHAPGSAKTYTQAQADDGWNPPDWFPNEHPPMPDIVAHGSKPAIRGCALCHLANGMAHPESASLAGQPVGYLIRQMAAFRDGERKGIRAGTMIAIAKAISEEKTRAASAYFASLKPVRWIRVVETDTVPKSHIGPGGMRFADAGGGSEPIGNRIIELPEDPARALMRDPHSGFVDYVPRGSIAKGKALVTAGAGKTTACATCHGEGLHGLAEVPGIAGRSPLYAVRQLFDMQSGNRNDAGTPLMSAVVAKLEVDDMAAIAAYLGTLQP